jgi:hypothetical protein
MGAYDDYRSSKSPSAAPPSIRESLSAAEARADVASAKLDKVFANPKATNKQTAAALDQWLKASNEANKFRGQLANSGSSVPSINKESKEGNSFEDKQVIYNAPTPVYATPPTPPPPPPPPPTVSVKTAPIDTVLFDDESVPVEIISDLLFENIGAHELINISRNDIVNGQDISYNLIKNLSSIQQQYNPNNILGLQSTSNKYFANFSIKLEDKIPQVGNGPNGSYVYLDENTGSIVIEAQNVEIGEEIEIQITSSGTIYEAEFGESNS